MRRIEKLLLLALGLHLASSAFASEHPFRFDLLPQPSSQQSPAIFANGTGTRGGGSGVLTNGSPERVEILDIYRSQEQGGGALFFLTDPHFIDLAGQLPADKAEQAILEAVFARIERDIPRLAVRMDGVRQKLPFEQWTASPVELPLQKDFHGELHLDDKTQRHVQIAYRRANQIIYDKKLFFEMDGLNRAALIIHEYLYAISGLQDSYSIQQLVSFLFSSDQDRVAFKKSALESLQRLLLGSLASSDMNLPEGVALSDDIKVTSGDICGTVSSAEALGGHAKGSIKITINVDPRRLHLSRDDFTAENFLKDPPQFTKAADIVLHGDDMKVAQAYFFAKDYLEKKYPIYLYPAQSSPADILCVNKRSGKVTALDMAIALDPQANDLDLENAQAEADYYRVYEDYLEKKRTQTWLSDNALELPLMVPEMKLMNAQYLSGYNSSLGTLGALVAISRAKVLEELRLVFESKH